MDKSLKLAHVIPILLTGITYYFLIDYDPSLAIGVSLIAIAMFWKEYWLWRAGLAAIGLAVIFSLATKNHGWQGNLTATILGLLCFAVAYWMWTWKPPSDPTAPYKDLLK